MWVNIPRIDNYNNFPARLPMKKYQMHYFFSLIYSLFIFTNVQAIETTPSPESVRLLASQCAQCHGTTGNSLGDFDSIAGENFNELLAELLDMKNGDDNKVMHKQIQGYTNEQIWYIAEDYANSKEISNEDNKSEDRDEEKIELKFEEVKEQDKKYEENKEYKENKEDEEEEDDDDEDEDEDEDEGEED